MPGDSRGATPTLRGSRPAPTPPNAPCGLSRDRTPAHTGQWHGAGPFLFPPKAQFQIRDAQRGIFNKQSFLTQSSKCKGSNRKNNSYHNENQDSLGGGTGHTRGMKLLRQGSLSTLEANKESVSVKKNSLDRGIMESLELKNMLK